MKRRRFAFHFLLAGFALTSACADDSSSLFSSMQGVGGTSGSDGGGSASGGTNGASAGSAGMSGGSAGTIGSAGTVNGGGSNGIDDGGAAGANDGAGGTSAGGGGSSGSAGAGGTDLPSQCPANVPEAGEGCDPDEADEPCRYTGVVCRCGGFFGGAEDEWSCLGDGDACPQATPDEGSSCEDDGDALFLCPYLEESCVCFNEAWWCFDFD